MIEEKCKNKIKSAVNRVIAVLFIFFIKLNSKKIPTVHIMVRAGIFFMRFFKMQNLGNDFIFTFDKTDGKVAKILCDRNFGVGADGVVQIGKEQENFSYKIFNSDGSDATFCGSATLCLAKYLRLKNRAGKNILIKTPCGLKEVQIVGKGVCERVILKVGRATFQKEKGEKYLFNRLLFLKEGSSTLRVRASLVSVGNLHLVIEGRYEKTFQQEVVRRIQNSELFFSGVNIEFAYKTTKGIFIDVYERGVGKTLCCTSGASAVFALFNKLNKCKNREKIYFGKNFMWAENKNNNIFITSNPAFVFEGVTGDKI